jgi:tetratricopeptide (TPR) repeat protein
VPDETKDSERLWPGLLQLPEMVGRHAGSSSQAIFHPKQAISLFQQCTRYCPRHPQSYGNMGICYGKLGQKALALQALDMALELDPGYEPAIINRAVVESLKEGEKLPPDKVESVEYYKDYALTQKSYIQTLIQQGENSIKS